MNPTTIPRLPPEEQTDVQLETFLVDLSIPSFPSERSPSHAELLERPSELLGLAVEHGLVPALGAYISHTDAFRDLPTYWARHVVDAWNHNRARTSYYADLASRAIDALRRSGIPAAVTKGNACQSVLYRRIGYRSFNDIDLLVDSANVHSANAALAQAGFVPNRKIDRRTETLIPISRRERVMFMMFPDHLPPFHVVSDRLDFPMVKVDVALSITWHSSEWQLPTDKILESVRDVPAGIVGDGSLPALSPAWSFIHLCLHLFREGFFVKGYKTVRLSQFADIVLAWDGADDVSREQIVGLAAKFDLSDALLWVTIQVDEVYGTQISRPFTSASIDRELWPRTYQDRRSGQYFVWSSGPRKRMLGGRRFRDAREVSIRDVRDGKP